MKNKIKEIHQSYSERYASDFSVLAAIWSLCIAWPLYQVFIAGPTFFPAHNAGRTDILIFVLLFSFGFPCLWALISTLTSTFSHLMRNILFAIGVCLPLTLFLAKLFLYQPWSWLPVLGVWILGLLLAALAILITVILTRWRPSWQGVTFGIAVALLVIGLFIFSPSMVNFFFQKSSQLTVASKIEQIDHEKKPNIIILLFDELSLMEMMDGKDKINERLFPNFAKFSKESLWFPHAYSPYACTHSSLSEFWTGKFVSEDLPPSTSSYPDSFVNLLKKREYQISTHEICSNFFPGREASKDKFISNLAIVVLNVIMPPAFLTEMDIPSITANWSDFVHEDENEKLKQTPEMWDRDYDTDSFFDSINHSESFFAFYHFLLPHFPYKFLYNGKLHNLGLYGFKTDGDFLPKEKDIINTIKMQYLQQACYADNVLGRVFEKMKQDKIYEDSIIIVFSDHGIVNEPGQQRKIYSENNIAIDLAGVPMFMKIPGEKNGIKNDIVRYADIVPTLADSLNWNIPWKVDGKSLLAKYIKTDDERFLTFFHYPLKPLSPMSQKDYLERFQERLKQKRIGLSVDYRNAGEIYFTDDYKIAGSKVENYQLKTSSKFTATIENQHFYENFNINGNIFPVFLKGAVNAPTSTPIVFALNGKIYYVGDSFDQNKNWGLSEFICYFPLTAFVDGYNKIELFVPVYEGGKIYLSPLEIKKDDCIQFIGESELIYKERKIKIRNEDSFIQGYAGDVANVTNGVLTLQGWAIDKKRNSGIDGVLLFFGNQVIAFSLARDERQDVADAFKDPRYEKSGFSLIASNITMNDLSHARLIAISDDIAKELPLPGKVLPVGLESLGKIRFSETGLNWSSKNFLPSNSDEMRGHVEICEIKDKELVILGWIFDFTNKKSAEKYLVMIDRQTIAGPTSEFERPDLVQAFHDKAAIKAGFDIHIPLNDIEIDLGAIKEVKVYGLSSGRYIELISSVNMKP